MNAFQKLVDRVCNKGRIAQREEILEKREKALFRREDKLVAGEARLDGLLRFLDSEIEQKVRTARVLLRGGYDTQTKKETAGKS